MKKKKKSYNSNINTLKKGLKIKQNYSPKKKKLVLDKFIIIQNYKITKYKTMGYKERDFLFGLRNLF